MRSQLPKTLNGSQGNVAGKTIDSVRLVEWGLSRLNEITKQYNYNEATLLSCMTLDVEHFHATTHFKSESMTMLQYCRSFGNCVKESLKKLSLWSAHYFTNPRSWYPPPESAMQLKEIPQLKPLPSKELSSQDCHRLSNFARQRSVRQETTMAKAGTLPFSCYETNLPIQKVVLRSRERLGNMPVAAPKTSHAQQQMKSMMTTMKTMKSLMNLKMNLTVMKVTWMMLKMKQGLLAMVGMMSLLKPFSLSDQGQDSEGQFALMGGIFKQNRIFFCRVS